jgi:hypothetical protein
VETRVALEVLSVDVGTETQHGFCHLFLVVHTRMVKQGVPFGVSHVSINVIACLGFGCSQVSN